MVEESPANPSTPAETPATPPETSAIPSIPPFPTTWALPDGIEDDIEQALVKTAMGAVAGGVAGLILFKGGKGTRAASIATGIGAGIGSTWERVKFRYEQSENK